MHCQLLLRSIPDRRYVLRKGRPSRRTPLPSHSNAELNKESHRSRSIEMKNLQTLSCIACCAPARLVLTCSQRARKPSLCRTSSSEATTPSPLRFLHASYRALFVVNHSLATNFVRLPFTARRTVRARHRGACHRPRRLGWPCLVRVPARV